MKIRRFDMFTIPDKVIQRVNEKTKAVAEKLEIKETLLNIGYCLNGIKYKDMAIGNVAKTTHVLKLILKEKFNEEQFFQKVFDEQVRAEIIYPKPGCSYDDWYLIIIEEYGEMIKEFNNQDYQKMEAEAVQFVAMIFKFIENIGK